MRGTPTIAADSSPGRAEVQYRASLESDLEQAQREKAYQEQRQREEREKLAKDAKETLMREVKSWKQACEIREYVSAVRATVHGCDGTLPAEMQEWIAWALCQADEVDPIASGRRPTVDAKILPRDPTS